MSLKEAEHFIPLTGRHSGASVRSPEQYRSYAIISRLHAGPQPRRSHVLVLQCSRIEVDSRIRRHYSVSPFEMDLAAQGTEYSVLRLRHGRPWQALWLELCIDSFSCVSRASTSNANQQSIIISPTYWFEAPAVRSTQYAPDSSSFQQPSIAQTHAYSRTRFMPTHRYMKAGTYLC